MNGDGSAMPSRMVGRSRIEMRSVSSSLQHALDARDGDLARHDVLDQFCCSLGRPLSSYCTLA